MSIRTCLFVGGPVDGTWHEVDTDYPIWRVPVPQPIPIDRRPDALPPDLCGQIACYKTVSFHFGDREIFICQHIEMQLDPLGLLHHICEGYRK